MTIELRCDGNLFGVISDDGTTVEVKCRRRKCGYQPGLVVLHTLSLQTGEKVQTRVFRNPPEVGKES